MEQNHSCRFTPSPLLIFYMKEIIGILAVVLFLHAVVAQEGKEL
jgi:hypothetical protein